jgi:hypothetical protein
MMEWWEKAWNDGNPDEGKNNGDRKNVNRGFKKLREE